MMTFYEIIEKSIKDRKMISVCYKKIDWDYRIIGFAICIVNDTVIIDEVNKFGKVTRKRKLLLKHIECVENNDLYNNQLEFIAKSGLSSKEKARYLHSSSNKITCRRLRNLMSKNYLCTFFFNENYVTGFLKACDKNDIIIRKISYFGNDDGEIYIKRKLLTQVRFNSLNEIKIYKLYSEYK